MWANDGWGWRARIGVLVPHADVNPESEFNAMAPDGVSIHSARVPFGGMGRGGRMDPTISQDPVRGIVEPPAIDDAAALLADAPVHVIGFAFTSSSYVLGAAGDDELARRIEDRAGIPFLVACSSAVEALRALDVSSIAVINPPWFDHELTDLGRRYFEAAGIGVAHASAARIPSDQFAVHPGIVYRYARDVVPPDADAVFFGGNGFRSVGVVEALETDLGRPVVTANQALFWHALRAAGVPSAIEGYGRLLALAAPAQLVSSSR